MSFVIIEMFKHS